MKKIVLIVALLGFGLICLQQRSYADKKMSHAEYAKSPINECNECHKGEGVAPNHGPDFVREHRVLASKVDKNCNQCHDQAWCLDCHQGGGTGDDLTQSNAGRDYKPKSHRSDWLNLHPMKAQDNQQRCYRCHDQKYCSACHSKFPQNSLKSLGYISHNNSQGVGWGIEHGSEARRNLQACQSCHADGDVCLKCHSAKLGGVNPHPRGFRAGNLKDRSNSNTCVKCHLPGTF